MKDKLRILTVGGDMRQLYCARRLAHEYDTSVLGFDEEYLSSSELSEVRGRYDCVILPVPPLNNEGNIAAPCGSGAITADEVKSLLSEDGFILAGHVGESLRKSFQGIEVIDYLEREELSLKNAVPTAEGAVQIALEELPVTLSGLNVLIVGMGRIGTALSTILKGFGAEVTAAVHNERGAAKARIAGIKSVYTDNLPTGFELVFNTAPRLVFNKELLRKFSEKTLFIDLASKPGGIDFESASELGIRAVWALGLPGKTAPVTAGEIIAETVMEIIGERRKADD
ncbi:MAG: dipicolinate synthase subunit A [Ruminococcus sp.]|nr:dipicolinate synthase subunit A [Ruminococcus sp.]